MSDPVNIHLPQKLGVLNGWEHSQKWYDSYLVKGKWIECLVSKYVKYETNPVKKNQLGLKKWQWPSLYSTLIVYEVAAFFTSSARPIYGLNGPYAWSLKATK